MTDSPIPSRQLFFEDFAPLEGQIFLADCEPKAAEITLVDARLLRASPGFELHISRPPFALIFHSSPMILLIAGIYQVRCGGFGPEPIYLEQTSPPQKGAIDGHYYQAIFN